MIGSNGIGFAVYDGAGILTPKGRQSGQVAAYPDAPRWASDPAAASFVVTPAETRSSVKLAWSAVPGAAAYRVLVAADPTMAHVD